MTEHLEGMAPLVALESGKAPEHAELELASAQRSPGRPAYRRLASAPVPHRALCAEKIVETFRSGRHRSVCRETMRAVTAHRDIFPSTAIHRRQRDASAPNRSEPGMAVNDRKQRNCPGSRR